MKIHIVAPVWEDWILLRIAKSFQSRIPGSTISDIPDIDADVNFYVNYALYKHPTSCDIGFFTHKESDSNLAEEFTAIANKMDGCVAMCKKTAALLPSEKTCIVKVGPDTIFRKKNLVLGVVAREYATGRKRAEWIQEIRKIPGVSVKFTNGKYRWSAMPSFYKSIDYLLILSKNEGGPIPLQEALRMGKPVISSDVGFVSDYTTLRYESLPQLLDIINGLIVPNDIWETASEDLVRFCAKVKDRTQRDTSSVRLAYKDEIQRQKSILYKSLIHAPMWVKGLAKAAFQTIHK